MTCQAKHTKYQPTDAEWKCPKCGSNHWHIEGLADDSDEACNQLHEEDELLCPNCDCGQSGKTYAARLVKQKNMIPCPHCKGAGLIKGDPK